MSTLPDYQQASRMTADNLRTIAETLSVQNLSRLTLPEVRAVVDLIAKVVPAGNVPGIILSGLARLPGRSPSPEKMRQDIQALFAGVEQLLDQAVYGAFFAGPAAILWGYQNLLKLAGKDPEMSFPEGVWQFYAGYALRDDTARHTNETNGFDKRLREHDIRIGRIDRITAWVMAAISCLHQFDALLENEWRERVALSLLREVTREQPNAAWYASLYRTWELQRPYQRGPDSAAYDYPRYRRFKFDQFMETALQNLPPASRAVWDVRLCQAIEKDLPAYQRQMSIVSYLDPEPYQDARIHFPLIQAHVGIIYQGGYYLLPACEPGSARPSDVIAVRAQVTSLVNSPAAPPARLEKLAQVRRAAFSNLCQTLSRDFVQDLEKLHFAPILINVDPSDASLPLADLRQGERGVGGHALTISDNGETIIFDQSHIYFDGTWGAALAEILTNEALSWAVYLHRLHPPLPVSTRAYQALAFKRQPKDDEIIQRAPLVTAEASAESSKVNLKAVLTLRRLLKRRGEFQLTVNDLLVLYRAIHALSYQPSPALSSAVDELSRTHPGLAASLRQALENAHSSPALIIPIDASQRAPRERLYPLIVDVPLADLDLLSLHQRAVELLGAYETAAGERSEIYNEFDRTQRIYLASLAGLGAFLYKAKQVAGQGESASVGVLKLMAHLPASVQYLLDKLPDRFELLNNILKGREVLSNVGAVVPTSTLTRFITAKDDNNLKQFVWGVITDANSIMRISLRDFRPHVKNLLDAGHKELAHFVAQDYLDAYVNGLNVYVEELARVTLASRETQASARVKEQATDD